MQPKACLDPIRFEVIRSALVESTEEMAISLRRSAYSTNIKTRADFSCAFFNRKLQPIAQAFGQAVHLGSLVVLVPRAIKEYGLEKLEEGDAILTNDPYLGGVHLNDITLISPVYYQNECFGYVANLAHHVDVGGGAPASIGAFREVYQEGIIIPPIKLVRGGEMVKDLFALVLAQMRSRVETAGDFRAQLAANITGVRRLRGLLTQWGSETVSFYQDELVAYTERRARAELSRLPQGTFTAQGYVDNDGFTKTPVLLVVKVVIDDQGVLFDFSGSDQQRPAPVNSTYSMTYSACAYVLKCLIDSDVPVNDGFYCLVKLIAPEGTVVNAKPPAPVVGGWETQTRLTDVILKALAPALPDRVPAGTKAMQCQVGFGGINPRTGELYAFYEAIAGGYGGRVCRDGPDAVQAHGQNTENAPIEEIEINYPVQIVCYELVENSEGAGKQRGGLGLRRDYRFSDHDVSFTILADRDRWGPSGLFGGLPGRKASYILNPDGIACELGSKVTLELKPGDVVSYRTCGGGGYGNPFQRELKAVLLDVREGKIGLERASKVYGVAINPITYEVDQKQTKALRSKKE